MAWIRVFQTLSYITALSIAATFFIPPTSVGGSGNTVIPDSYMKKTLRDHLNKEKFLRHIRDRLMENGRNSTAASSPRRSMFPSLSQDKTSLTNTPATQISHNVTTVGRLVPEKGITSKSFVSGLSYPNLVHSESEGNDVCLSICRSVCVPVLEANIWIRHITCTVCLTEYWNVIFWENHVNCNSCSSLIHFVHVHVNFCCSFTELVIWISLILSKLTLVYSQCVISLEIIDLQYFGPCSVWWISVDFSETTLRFVRNISEIF